MILDPVLDLFRGKAVTIPPMDGALKPNTALDEAEVALALPAPDALAAAGGSVLVSSGRQVRRLGDDTVLAGFEAPVTALAASPGGRVAAALETGAILVDGTPLAGGPIPCPVALAFGDETTLYACSGSDRHPPSGWATDLMEGNAAGTLWRLDLAGGGRQALARGLAFPYGVAVDTARRRLVVSESWRHRLVSVPLEGGAPAVLLDELPGYPARLAPAGEGALLAVFAPRNRLIEFVLQEHAYRADMMREIDPQHWIAPSLSPSRTFLEPLQNGGVRTMGIHKPWSPSRSCGLVVELDRDWRPLASHHSRANGRRHGVTSAIAWQGRILAAAKGGDCVLTFPSGSETRPA